MILKLTQISCSNDLSDSLIPGISDLFQANSYFLQVNTLLTKENAENAITTKLLHS